MKRILGLLFVIILMSACTERGCQRFDRKTQFSEKNYHIKQYSGGKLIGEWTFKGIVNAEENSDGYYFKYNGEWVEISGDVQITYK